MADEIVRGLITNGESKVEGLIWAVDQMLATVWGTVRQAGTTTSEFPEKVYSQMVDLENLVGQAQDIAYALQKDIRHWNEPLNRKRREEA